MTLEALAGFVAIVSAQALLFAMSTTGLAVNAVGSERLPGLAREIASSYRMTPGRMHVVGALLWLGVAVLVAVLVIANGVLLDTPRDVAAGLTCVLFDVAWISYLFRSRGRAPGARPDE